MKHNCIVLDIEFLKKPVTYSSSNESTWAKRFDVAMKQDDSLGMFVFQDDDGWNGLIVQEKDAPREDVHANRYGERMEERVVEEEVSLIQVYKDDIGPSVHEEAYINQCEPRDSTLGRMGPADGNDSTSETDPAEEQDDFVFEMEFDVSYSTTFPFTAQMHQLLSSQDGKVIFFQVLQDQDCGPLDWRMKRRSDTAFVGLDMCLF